MRSTIVRPGTDWATTDGVRVIVSRLSHLVRMAISETIAALVYWPLARLKARFGELAATSWRFMRVC
jgi:hypothetical protein